MSVMQQDPIDYEAIERRVVIRMQRRYRFFYHSAIFFLGIPVIGAWGSPEIFLGWVGGWIFHFMWMQYQNNIEKAIEHEIEYERDKVIKRKREYAEIYERYQNGDFQDDYEERPEWLSDDGEIRGYDYEEDY
jgi:hypothetical protein